ncbi:MAG TPA: hypothetical protein VLA36_01795, partial [Longimicrobiales bacterium]|nr:hypothetical protein [Longimicrobiales bacterium]
RFEEGLEARRAFDRDFPDEPSALPGLAGNLAFMGHRQESEALDSLWLPLVPRPLDPSWAITFAWRGDTVRARAILDTALVALEEGRKLSPQGFAYAYLGLGQYDEALDWLERAADESHYWLLRDPAFDPLVPDPRFQALWKRVGLKGEPKAGRQPARPAG